jgi:hypothetical protein
MTADLPTPVDVPVGWAVRVCSFKQTYVSRIMSPAEARSLADELHDAAERIGATYGFIPGVFVTGDGHVVRLRARQVTSIDVGPPPARREQPAAPVHVHLHMGSGDVTEEEAEEPVSLVPTPKALADRLRKP